MFNFRHPKKGYVFIVTYGRSGSTLLQSLLNGIAGYQIRGENNNALFHMYRSWSAIRSSKPLDGMRQSGTRTTPENPWYGGEKINPDTLGRNMALLFAKTVLQPDYGTRVSGFKEIRFTTEPRSFFPYLNFIYRYFPNSRFVFNTRNHADVMKSGWWPEQDPDEVSGFLQTAERLYHQYVDTYPERGILLHYDDYTDDRSHLVPLFNFLGEPLDECVINQALDKRLNHLMKK